MDEKPYASTYDDEHQVLAVSGSVDELEGPAFRADIETHSEGYARSLTLDLTDVEFFPSLAVGVLAVALNRGRETGHEIEVRALEGSIVARVLTVCALPYTSVPATEA